MRGLQNGDNDLAARVFNDLFHFLDVLLSTSILIDLLMYDVMWYCVLRIQHQVVEEVVLMVLMDLVVVVHVHPSLL